MAVSALSGLFLASALVVVCNINAMDSSMDLDFKRLTLDDYEKTPQALFIVHALGCLEQNFCLIHDICNIILVDFYELHLSDVSHYLKENQRNPANVLIMINRLFKDYGHDVSVWMLKRALVTEKMWIGDIKGEWPINHFDGTCLHTACNQNDINSTKIILDVAGTRACELISILTPGYDGWTAWYWVIKNGHEAILDVFLQWAADNNKEIALLLLRAHDGETPVSTVAYWSKATIFKKLLEFADIAIPGFSAKLLVSGNSSDNSVLSYALYSDKYPGDKKNEEIVQIIKFYSEKYQIESLLLELQEL